MTKKELVEVYREKLKAEIQLLESVLGDSVDNATGDETKSEGKYDTRATEAAYLAEGQRGQLEAKKKALASFEQMVLKDYPSTAEIEAGCLVEVEQDEGELGFYFLAQQGGGLVADFLGCEATVITPDSKLYQWLLGQRLGALIEENGWRVMGVE